MKINLVRRTIAAGVAVALMSAPVAAFADDVVADQEQSVVAEQTAQSEPAAEDETLEEAVPAPAEAPQSEPVQAEAAQSEAVEEAQPQSEAPAVTLSPEKKPATKGKTTLAVTPKGKGSPVNWTKTFPDPSFRKAVQEGWNVELSRVTYGDLERILSLNLNGRKKVKNLKGIEFLKELRTLDLRGTNLTEVEFPKNLRLKDVYLSDSAICPTIPTPKGGLVEEYRLDECGKNWGALPSGGSLVIDETPHTLGGIFRTVTAFDDKKTQMRPLKFSYKNGVYSSAYMLDNKIRRDEKRQVNADGTVRTWVSFTNATQKPVKTHIVEETMMLPRSWAYNRVEGKNAIRASQSKTATPLHAKIHVTANGIAYGRSGSYDTTKNFVDAIKKYPELYPGLHKRKEGDYILQTSVLFNATSLAPGKSLSYSHWLSPKAVKDQVTPPKTGGSATPALVKWDREFPDGAFRAAVKANFKDWKKVTYRDLAAKTSLNVRGHKKIRSVVGLALFKNLVSVDFRDTGVSNVVLTKNPKVKTVLLDNTPICKPVSFKKQGKVSSYDPLECGVNKTRVAGFGAYVVAGKQVRVGSSKGDVVNVSASKVDSVRPLRFSVKGGKFTHVVLLGGKVERSETRWVDSKGVVRSSVSLKNVSKSSVSAQVVDGFDFNPGGKAKVVADGGRRVKAVGSGVTLYAGVGSAKGSSVYPYVSGKKTGVDVLKAHKAKKRAVLEKVKKGRGVHGHVDVVFGKTTMKPGAKVTYTHWIAPKPQ